MKFNFSMFMLTLFYQVMSTMAAHLPFHTILGGRLCLWRVVYVWSSANWGWSEGEVTMINVKLLFEKLNLTSFLISVYTVL